MKRGFLCRDGSTVGGVVRARDPGESRFVEDFPADPASEGWEKVE